jgi:hypothetical protein
MPTPPRGSGGPRPPKILSPFVLGVGKFLSLRRPKYRPLGGCVGGNRPGPRSTWAEPPPPGSVKKACFRQSSSKICSSNFFQVLSSEFAKVGTLHGDLKQSERMAALQQLRDVQKAIEARLVEHLLEDESFGFLKKLLLLFCGFHCCHFVVVVGIVVGVFVAVVVVFFCFYRGPNWLAHRRGAFTIKVSNRTQPMPKSVATPGPMSYIFF